MSNPHNEMQPIIDAMECGDGNEEWSSADNYTDYLLRMDNLGIDVD